MTGVDELEREWQDALDAWLVNTSPVTDRRLQRAAEALRLARQARRAEGDGR